MPGCGDSRFAQDDEAVAQELRHVDIVWEVVAPWLLRFHRRGAVFVSPYRIQPFLAAAIYGIPARYRARARAPRPASQPTRRPQDRKSVV